MRYARAPELAVRTSISRSWSRRWLRPLQQADCMCRLQCARGRYRHGWAAAGCPHADVGQAPVRWRITTDCAAAAARPKPCCLQGFDKGRWAAAGMARHFAFARVLELARRRRGRRARACRQPRSCSSVAYARNGVQPEFGGLLLHLLSQRASSEGNAPRSH